MASSPRAALLTGPPTRYPLPRRPPPGPPQPRFSERHRAPSQLPTPPGSLGTPAGSTCVSELALLLFLLAIEKAPGGGGSGGGGTDGGSGRPIDTSRPGKGKGELQLCCPARRRRTSNVPARARHDDAGRRGGGALGRAGRAGDGRTPDRRAPRRWRVSLTPAVLVLDASGPRTRRLGEPSFPSRPPWKLVPTGPGTRRVRRWGEDAAPLQRAGRARSPRKD